MNKKGSVSLIIVSALIALIAITIGAIFFIKYKEPSRLPQIKVPTPTSVGESANLETPTPQKLEQEINQINIEDSQSDIDTLNSQAASL